MPCHGRLVSTSRGNGSGTSMVSKAAAEFERVVWASKPKTLSMAGWRRACAGRRATLLAQRPGPALRARADATTVDWATHDF
eukprot:2454121-Pleurochrysis_carterae.AAC.1